MVKDTDATPSTPQQRGGHRVLVGVRLVRHLGGDEVIVRLGAEGGAVEGRRHVYIIVHIVFRDTANRHLGRPAVTVPQGEGIPGPDAELRGQLFGQEDAVFRERYGFAALCAPAG